MNKGIQNITIVANNKALPVLEASKISRTVLPSHLFSLKQTHKLINCAVLIAASETCGFSQTLAKRRGISIYPSAPFYSPSPCPPLSPFDFKKRLNFEYPPFRPIHMSLSCVYNYNNSTIALISSPEFCVNVFFEWPACVWDICENLSLFWMKLFFGQRGCL